MPISTHDFVAVVVEDSIGNRTKVEMRNKFLLNETLELLSKTQNNAIINIEKIEDEDGNELDCCNVPKQQVYITTNLKLNKHDNVETNEDEFDIEKYLNENWDVIDKAVGEVKEKVRAKIKTKTRMIQQKR